MINPQTQGCTIIVDELNTQYHSIHDWGLGVENNDYIGTPVLYTNYIQVPGANKLLDASQTLTGRRTYDYRPINIKFGAVNRRESWDSIMSQFRNKIDGRIIRVIFDNDANYYWTGRCQLTEFDRVRELGTFRLQIPKADPYKYNIRSNVEPWLWDPFNFITDSIPEEPVIEIDGTKTVTIPAGTMYTVPKFTVKRMITPLNMTVNGRVYELKTGDNYFPAVNVNGDFDVNLVFSGVGEVVIEYRGGSL